LFLAKYLYKSGYDVFCPVLPGHLASMQEVMETTWRDWYGSALNEHDRLRGSYEDIGVTGVCLGATLGLLLSVDRPNIKALGALAPVLFLDGWSIPKHTFLLWLCIASPLQYF